MDYSLLIGITYAQFTISHHQGRHQKSTRQSMDPVDTEIAELASTVGIAHGNISNRNENDGDDDDEEQDALTTLAHPTQRQQDQLPTEDEVEAVLNDAAAVETSSRAHRYHAHKVAGPSVYYLGIVDVLQDWTLAKQAERFYKVHVLRKDPRGVSAIAPQAYAARFQQKMAQLLAQRVADGHGAAEDSAD